LIFYANFVFHVRLALVSCIFLISFKWFPYTCFSKFGKLVLLLKVVQLTCLWIPLSCFQIADFVSNQVGHYMDINDSHKLILICAHWLVSFQRSSLMFCTINKGFWQTLGTHKKFSWVVKELFSILSHLACVDGLFFSSPSFSVPSEKSLRNFVPSVILSLRLSLSLSLFYSLTF